MSAWREGKLGDFLELKRGYDLPTQDRRSGEFPIVSSSGITGAHAEAKADGPGVVMGRYGTIGQVFFVETSYWPLNTTLYVRDFKGNDPRFIAYFLRTFDFNAFVDKAAVPGVNRNDVHAAHVRVPCVDVQQRVAALLGALDDKIALNRRMNETLEALLSTVVLESQQAEKTAFGDIAENTRDTVDPAGLEPDTPYIALEHMPRGSIALAEWSKAGSVSSVKSRFRRGDILFGKLRPYFHKVGVAPTDGVCSTDILVIRAKAPELRALAVAVASSSAFVAYATATSTGTKMPRASWRDLSNFEFDAPDHARLGELNVVSTPLLEQIEANIMESRTLAALRDTLLPKLISGELRIRKSTSAVENGM